jgi:molybdate transport system regulatory protein
VIFPNFVIDAPVFFCPRRGQLLHMTRLTIRIDFADGTALGPGKVRLLELVAETGSIRKAAVRMKMSYRKAWLLLKALKDTFGEALVETTTGGRAGGGARLTPLGRFVVNRYRNLEQAAAKAGATPLTALARRLVPKSRRKTQGRRRVSR